MSLPMLPLRRTFFACLLMAAAMPPGIALAEDEAYSGRRVIEFTCPVGGQTFSQDVAYSALMLVQFPDGSWLGDDLIDAQIPECPGNGLVLIPNFDNPGEDSDLEYRTYTAAERARLPALIDSDAYRALKGKGRYQRAQWIATQLGMSARTRFELLVRSSWAAVAPAERRRLVTRIAEEGPALVEAMPVSALDTLMQRFRIANALRELGRFDEAGTLADTLYPSITDDMERRDPEGVSALTNAIGQLLEIIEARDDDRFPVGMMSERWANQICKGAEMRPPYGPKTAQTRAGCERRDRERRELSEAVETASRLRGDPATLARMCTTTPITLRNAGLTMACRELEYEREQQAGMARLRTEPAKVAAECEAIAQRERPPSLDGPCRRYEEALSGALKTLMADDDATFAALCPQDRPYLDPAAYLRSACDDALALRSERESERWLADPVTLDKACAAKGERSAGLYDACIRRARNVHDERVRQLMADADAYKRTCAHLPPSDPADIDDDSDRRICEDAAYLLERKRTETAQDIADAQAAASAAMAAADHMDDRFRSA